VGGDVVSLAADVLVRNLVASHVWLDADDERDHRDDGRADRNPARK
jgi:hypothetical protein